MIEESIRKEIEARLSEIEADNSVDILLAVESGSRAWGFESTDSDYDVRFIYRREPASYIEVFPSRDVIEYPVSELWDFSGWDLSKALLLLSRSNPVLFEWLNSPIVYRKHDGFLSGFKTFAERYYSKISATYHYLQMAKNNYRHYLQTGQVKIKKYFYVLRPLLACMWIENTGRVPPIEFEVLFTQLEDDAALHGIITELLARKKSGVELGLEERIPEINRFAEEKIEYFEAAVRDYAKTDKPRHSEINEKFRELLNI